ncbi:hypothetical protein EDB80DRAFT_748905 [Ilyonectria destructans]|nr:hypothetical protein EDB80DRAFT_748905 [Ilyonectria destructans]
MRHFRTLWIRECQRGDSARVHQFLAYELNTPVLDQFHSMLWIFSIKPGHNIGPIHRHGKIYINTMPICLLNRTVWEAFLQPEKQSPVVTVPDSTFGRRVALGFLRSYAFFIQSPFDLTFAKEVHPVPDDFEMDWIGWAKFIAQFRRIEDSQVSKRYHFGQLRLDRLNWATRLV